MLTRTTQGKIGLANTKTSRTLAIRAVALLFIAGVWLGDIGVTTQLRLTNASTNAVTNCNPAITKTAKATNREIAAGSVYNTTSSPLQNDSSKKHPSTTPQKDRLVISIKTMPERIQYIQPTLDSLLFHQTVPFDRLYLVLPEQRPSTNSQYVIPEFVTNYSHRGLLTILRPAHDFGAIDKMIHTLPVEYEIYQKQQHSTLLQEDQFRILYCDDDMIYDPRFVELLASKSDEYPNDVVALSGGNLTSHFRQIGHSDPHHKSNRHPYLYYWVGGVDSQGDPIVDIVQGFMGVVVRLSFFHVHEFVSLAGNASFPEGVRRLDDFVICGYLESRNITRRCVDGGLVPHPNPTPSRIGNLGKTMHRNAMIAASFLQREWGIWSQYTFEPYEQLSERIRNLIDCEARHAHCCPDDVKDAQGKPIYSKVTKLLDDEFGISEANLQ